MVSFISAIYDYITGFFEFFSSMFESFIWLVGTIPQMMSSYSATFAFVPDFLFPFLTLSASLTAIFAIIRLI
jgi:hypothetical protein